MKYLGFIVIPTLLVAHFMAKGIAWMICLVYFQSGLSQKLS